MSKVDDEIMVCQECLMVIANGDYTGLNYHTTPDNPDYADRREQEINDGLESLEGYVCVGDSDKDDEFSTSPCECCGESLHGSRHHVVLLTD